jgi:hypothetical protein
MRTRNRERALEIRFRFRRIPLARHQRDFPGHAMDIGLEPSFLCCFHHRHRFINTARSIIEFADLRVSPGQIG